MSADQVGLKVIVSTKKPNVPFAVSVSGTWNTKYVTVQTATAGRYLVRCWLTDTDTDFTETPFPPSLSRWTKEEKVTDANGQVVFTVQDNDGVSARWYAHVVVIGRVGTTAKL